MKLFIFDRPFTSRFTSQYRALYGGRDEIRYVSDFRYRDDVGLISRQYRHLRHSDADRDRGLDYVIIARRCRYLRAQEPQLQRRLINSAWLAIEEIFGTEKPDAFIGLPMDNYYLDLIDQYCVANGIFTINPVQSFVPNRTRVCRRGEYNHVREVGADEIAEYRAILLEKRFRPTWLSKHRTHAQLMKMYFKEVAKKALFAALKIAKRDPYAFHYNCVYPIGPSINTSSVDLMKIADLFVKDISVVESRARGYQRAVFLPLQFSPESSIDYNIPDSRFSWYDKLIDLVLENLPADTLLVVKEHPDMYGYRRFAWYERFLGRPNVLLADVKITVQELFDFCEYVLVTGSASTGGEAAVKGRTVISLGGAFYGGETGTIHEITNFDDVPRWSEWLRPIRNDAAKIDGIVKRILENTLIGPYDFVRISRDKLPVAQANVQSIMSYVVGNV